MTEQQPTEESAPEEQVCPAEQDSASAAEAPEVAAAAPSDPGAEPSEAETEPAKAPPKQPETEAEPEAEPEAAAEPTGAEAESAAAPARPRRRLRTAARWSGAVVLCAAVGTATAFAVATPPRTDIPGLATPDDGRYTFPPLDLPALPSASASDATDGRVHIGDLRGLLLPAPRGATVDSGFPGAHGWYPLARYVKLGTNQDSLDENGCRHIAAEAWTMPDGTRTEIYLLGFRSHYGADAAFAADTSVTLSQASQSEAEVTTQTPPPPTGTVNEKEQSAGDGQRAVRYAFFPSGDVEALVIMSNAKAVPDTPFQQVILDQARLLA